MECLIDETIIRKKYKISEASRIKQNEYMKSSTVCPDCGESVSRANMTIHKRAKVHKMKIDLYNFKHHVQKEDL